jgi:hypothetical protein
MRVAIDGFTDAMIVVPKICHGKEKHYIQSMHKYTIGYPLYDVRRLYLAVG